MKPLAERFWSKAQKSDQKSDNGCREWIGRRDRNGYGRIGHANQFAHRVSWELHHGPIPKGMHVLHRCNNPGCLEPDHLYLGTHADNMRFKVECDRQAKGKSCQGYVKLTEREVLEIRGMSGIQKEIGSIYGISARQVSHIKRRDLWRHLV
jgi:hypothetical protein